MTRPAPPAAVGHRRQDLLVLLLFLLLTAVFFWRPVLAGQPLSAADILYQSPPWQHLRESAPILPGGQLWNRLMSDNVYGYYPEEVTAVRFLRQGLLPLWDPYVFSGTPLLAESQRGIFYPFNLLVRLIPFAWSFSYGVILHFFLAACFMYALLRHWGLTPGPAALGGLVFEFSGWMVAWVLTPYGIYTIVWLPLMILFYDQAIRRYDYRWAIATGLTLALQLFAGQIQFVSYNLIALGLYGAVQVALTLRRALDKKQLNPRSTAAAVGGPLDPSSDPRPLTPPILAPIWTGAIAIATGFLLAAVQLLPTFEIIGLSGRAIRAFDDMIDHDLMPLPHLFTLLVPSFFGTFLDGNYRGWLNMLETTFYFGIAPLFLAGVALVRQRRPAVFFLTLIGLLPLLVLLFPAVFSLFYLVVPGFKQTFPSRLLYLVPFGFAGLAAFGAAAIPLAVRDGARWPWRLCLWLLGGWTTLALLFLLVPIITAVHPASFARFGRLPELPYDAYQIAQLGLAIALLGLFVAALFVMSRRFVSPRLAASLLAGVVVIDLFAFGVNYNPAFPPEALYPVTPGIRYLQEQPEKARLAAGDGVILPPNAGAVYGLEDVRGYTSLYSARYQTTIEETQGHLPVFPLLEDGRPNRNHLLAIGRTGSPLLQTLNPRYLLERSPDLPVRSIRNWATGIRIDADIDDVYRPRVRDVYGWFERVIFAHPPAEITYQLPRLPDQAQLQLGFGIDSPAWYQRGDGVFFEVEARRSDGTSVLLLQRWVDPKNNPDDRRWFDEKVSLPGLTEGPIEITLRTSSGPVDDTWFDWALWSDPQIVFGTPLLSAFGEVSAGASGVLQQVSIDGVSHESVGLTAARPASAAVRVPDQGRLTFAAAALGVDDGWAATSARLTVRVAGSPVATEIFDPANRADQRHWTQVSVDLSDWAGETVDLHLDVSAEPGVRLAIGDPRLLDAGLDPGLDLVFNREIAIYRNSRAVARAFLVPEARPAESAEAALAAVTDPTFDPHRAVVIENAAAAPVASGSAGSAEILSYGPNEVVIATRSEGQNYLVLADAFYPGWRASLDGQDVPLYPANYIVRAVAVPAGEHTVRFTYLPTSLVTGAAISLATAAAILLALVLPQIVRRRSARWPVGGAA